jgi:phosphohistidine phosphatase SixA
MLHQVMARLLVVAAVLGAPASLAHKGIFVVRHAEKASSTDPDTSLSMQGEDRASALARLLRNAGVTHLFVTELKRTRQTLEPLADQKALTPTVVPAKDTAALVAALKVVPKDAVVVVAGHSNTVPDILKGLGITTPVTIRDDQYNRIFFITPDNQMIELAF